jgi:hypothetical protein
MSMVGHRGVAGHTEEPWFEEARIVDQEWIELLVMTPKGEKVYYRVPRRTLFRDIDRPDNPK